MKPETLARGMAILAEAFPQREVTNATIRLYRTMLADLDDDEFERGVRTCVLRGKFFPAVAEVRTAARPAPTAQDLGELFAKIELRILMSGTLREIEAEFGPTVKTAIGAVGFDEFRRFDKSKNRPFAFRQFVAAMGETHVEKANEQIVGPQQDRLAHLVKQTGKVLAFPARKTPPTRGIAS